MLRILRWLTIVVLLVAPGRVVSGETVAGLPAHPPGYVNDYAGILSPETRESLEELCTEVDQKAHAQIAVLTVSKMEADPAPSGKTGGISADQMPAPSIEEFATALEDKWKVGAKGNDRGVLVIVSLDPRKYRIEIGYGLEGQLNDAKVGDIGREMAPLLHTGDYNRGISLGVHEIAQDIATDAGVTIAALDANGEAPVQYSYEQTAVQPQVNPIAALIFGGIVLIAIFVLIRTGHIGLLFFLLFSLMGGGRGGGGFGGGDNEGGGGGFGGFGGGGSGGGGASGSF